MHSGSSLRRIQTTVQVKPTNVGGCLRVTQGGAVSGGKGPDGRRSCVAENKGVRTSADAE